MMNLDSPAMPTPDFLSPYLFPVHTKSVTWDVFQDCSSKEFSLRSLSPDTHQLLPLLVNADNNYQTVIIFGTQRGMGLLISIRENPLHQFSENLYETFEFL
jgi:hypothetical protein